MYVRLLKESGDFLYLFMYYTFTIARKNVVSRFQKNFKMSKILKISEFRKVWNIWKIRQILNIYKICKIWNIWKIWITKSWIKVIYFSLGVRIILILLSSINDYFFDLQFNNGYFSILCICVVYYDGSDDYRTPVNIRYNQSIEFDSDLIINNHCLSLARMFTTWHPFIYAIIRFL